jgi:hypothetical protein
MFKEKYIGATPNPEYLIKSIAEQGYTLETALADLIDNSISADANSIEIITDIKNGKITLYLADNGNGMTETELYENMRFPSSSIENERQVKDLGRFGLGMKTASFSQTRKFTTISRKYGSGIYSGATWDVKYLQESSQWRILINDEIDISEKVSAYNKLSNESLIQLEGFKPNTIIVWEGLYKFQNFIDLKNLENAFYNEIDNVLAEHLSIVFHRFMTDPKRQLKIKINNNFLKPFDPFPELGTGIRSMESKKKIFGNELVRIQGFVLPINSSELENINIWTTPKKALSDLEGIYIYRGGRIIFYGSWNGLIKKSPHLKLARLKLDVGNKQDDKLQLNVAKSNIVIPFELKFTILRTIHELSEQAKIEYANKGLRKKSIEKDKPQLINKIYTTKGTQIQINIDSPFVKMLTDDFSKMQLDRFKILIKLIETLFNRMKHVHEDKIMTGVEEMDGVNYEQLRDTIIKLKSLGMTKDDIQETLLNGMGFKFNLLPENITNVLI